MGLNFLLTASFYHTLKDKQIKPSLTFLAY